MDNLGANPQVDVDVPHRRHTGIEEVPIEQIDIKIRTNPPDAASSGSHHQPAGVSSVNSSNNSNSNNALADDRLAPAPSHMMVDDEQHQLTMEDVNVDHLHPVSGQPAPIDPGSAEYAFVSNEDVSDAALKEEEEETAQAPSAAVAAVSQTSVAPSIHPPQTDQDLEETVVKTIENAINDVVEQESEAAAVLALASASTVAIGETGTTHATAPIPAVDVGPAPVGAAPALPAAVREYIHGITATTKHDEKWNEMFYKLQDYKALHGHCNVPQNFKGGIKLGRWCHYQRVEYWLLKGSGAGKITEARIERLDAIGFAWDPQKAQWDDMFNKLIKFKEKYGHCQVSKNWKEDRALANWVRNQRLERAHKEKGMSSRMTEYRMKKLTSIGFNWSKPLTKTKRAMDRKPKSLTEGAKGGDAAKGDGGKPRKRYRKRKAGEEEDLAAEANRVVKTGAEELAGQDSEMKAGDRVIVTEQFEDAGGEAMVEISGGQPQIAAEHAPVTDREHQMQVSQQHKTPNDEAVTAVPPASIKDESMGHVPV